MDRNSVKWRGNICAIVTPFTKDGDLDEAAFCQNIELLISEGINGVIVAGCTGEFWALKDDERVRAFELGVATAKKRIPVLGGTSDIVTSRSVALTKRAKAVGCDGVMVTPPPYVLVSPREVIAHFRAISNVGLPIMMYNIPKRQGINVTPRLIAEMTDIECLVAVKQSSDSFHDVVETVRLAGDKLLIFAGHSVIRGFPSVAMGCDGFISSVEPQVMGREAIDLYRLAAANKVDEVRKLQYRCVALDEAIHGGVGTFPASLKAAMNLRGRPGGYAREPLLPLTDDEQAKLKKVLGGLGLLK